MAVLTKEVSITPSSRNVQYYKDKGYNAKCKEPLIVKIEDLQKGSRTEVEVLCDMCHKNKMTVKYKTYNRVVDKTGSYVCKECSHKKLEQTNLKKYGVKHYTQTKEYREKLKQTCLEKYNVEHSSQFQAVKDKRIMTNLERYGVEHFPQSEEFKAKQANTMLEHYGTTSVTSIPEVKAKIQQTLLYNYGVLNPSQSPEIRAKISQSFYKNSSKQCSKQQFYLNNLYGGKLNYPISYYNVDICLVEENMVIEYDGGGHNLSVKQGSIAQEEFDQKEIVRSSILKREGYKQMRIISTNDKLPSDSILLQMLEQARMYFSTTKHTWINFNISNSKMINAENKDIGGVFFDYGELHTIKNEIKKEGNNKLWQK